MKIALVSADGCGAWFLLRLAREGNDCDYFLTEGGPPSRVLRGMVPEPSLSPPKGWKQYDLVLFDGNTDGELADSIRKEAPVLGCSELSCRLEDDRLFGIEAMAAGGIDLPKYEMFDSPEKARAWIGKNPGRYVYKPSQPEGRGEVDCSVTYVSHSPSDMERALDRLYKESHGAPFLLQEFVEGVEISCYDDKTEILTENGWKFFPELTAGESVLTIDPKTNVMSYAVPQRIIKNRHSGEMVTYKSQMTDFCVTPNHRMLVRTFNEQTYKKLDTWSFKRADECEKLYECLYPKAGIWSGKEETLFQLPGTVVQNGWRGIECRSAVDLPMDDWLEFLGWYLSEGSFTRQGYTVIITQKKHAGKIENCLRRLPFRWNKNGINYRIHSKQLYEYVEQFGRSADKFVSAWIKKLSPRQIGVFLDAYRLGDGHTYPKISSKCFFTISPKMADDLQELCLKAGNSATVTSRPAGKDSRGVTRRKSYIVMERTSGKLGTLLKKNYSRVKYDGYVYCVSVPPNRTVYVRRNGRVMWSGNTEAWFDGSNFHLINGTLEEKKFLAGGLGQNTGCSGNVVWAYRNVPLVFTRGLGRMQGWLRDHEYRGMIDLNAIVTRQHVYGLEWTPRFGYAASPTLLSLLRSPWADFFHRIAAAPDGGTALDIDLEFEWGASVDISVPPYPEANAKADRNLPVEGISPEDAWRDTYLYDTMDGTGDLVTAGVNGDIGQVLGRGHTMRGAWKDALDAVKKVKAPDLQWRNDLESSTGERYRRLLAEGWL